MDLLEKLKKMKEDQTDVLPDPIKEIKPIKKAKKTIKPKIESDDIKITSDEFRTAFFLLTKTSSRKALIEIKDDLEQFLQEYELMKIGKDFYFSNES